MASRSATLGPYQYDPEKRRRAKDFTRRRLLLRTVDLGLVPFAFLGILLASGAAGFLRDRVLFVASGAVADALLVILYLLTFSMARLPIQVVLGFVYEHRHGLSNQTLWAWAKDWLKLLGVLLLLGAPIGTGLLVLFRATPLWWFWAAVAFSGFVVLFVQLVPILLLPILFKTEPLTDEAITRQILDVTFRAGAPEIRSVILLKASQKTKRVNAAFGGFGKTKRVFLFDTLLDGFPPDEVRVVVGHELGHYLGRDVWRQIALNGAVAFPQFYLVDALLRSAGPALGVTVGDPTAFPLMMLGWLLLDLALLPLTNGYSRHREALADAFALRVVGDPAAQASMIRRLGDLNLGDDDPPRIAEILLYDHPAAKKRIAMANDWPAQGVSSA